ncbi:hypothetical protein [Desulfovibrio sp.]|uniref:hypothetical protein n=1 Tax=Desulfovibrio sp. TaxID=885 RepID=UPI0025C085C8|nr:hypothetical protein [Desulfovibrio sp.]
MLVRNSPKESLVRSLWRQILYLVAVFLVAGLQLWFSGVLLMVRRTDALIGGNAAAGLIWLWYAWLCYRRDNFARMALSFMGLLGSMALAALGLADILF